MMGFVMQAVVREGERRGALGLESERQRVEGLLSTLSQRGGVNLIHTFNVTVLVTGKLERGSQGSAES